MSYFTVQNLFSLAARDRCLTSLKRMRRPTSSKNAKKPVKEAAVLIPLCSSENKVSLLYTVRSTDLRNHSGQISFPGGMTDQGETPIQTALRETQEEIGLKENRIDVWGQGPEFPGRDNKVLITPVISSIRDLTNEDLRINTKEVAEVFSISLECLCNPKNQYHTQFRNGYILPVFAVEDYKIWGVTAFITHAVLTSLLPPDVYHNEWVKKKIVVKNLSLDVTD